jgi:phage terminase large subunit-like protein
MKNNILLFGKIIMSAVFWAAFSIIHYKVEKLLLSDHKKLNIILPRGLGKTTLVSQVFSLYHIFLSDIQQPKFVVIVSKTQAHAINCLTAIKDVLEYSLPFRDMFGYWGSQSARQWTQDVVVLKDGSIIMAKGMGQPIRGLNIGGVRPTYIVIDDPEDENNTKTSEAMAANLTWVLKGALPALDSRYGRIITIGTPLHQLCIVERLAEASDWQTVRFPYLQNEQGEPDVVNGESMWKEVRSTESLKEEYEAMMAMGKSSVFFAERMCQITGDEAQLFKPHYIRYYKGHHIIEDGSAYMILTERGDEEFKPSLKIAVNIFMGVDPASSTKQGADYSVVFPIAIDNDDNIYTLNYFRRRVRPMELAEQILVYYDMFKPQRVRIESVGYQEMLRDYLRSKSYIPGLEIKEMPRNSKSVRLEGLEPRFASGKVYVAPTHEAFIDELLTYPRCKNDDCLDGFFYAQKNIYKPFHTVIEDQPKTKRKQVKENELEFDWLLS